MNNICLGHKKHESILGLVYDVTCGVGIQNVGAKFHCLRAALRGCRKKKKNLLQSYNSGDKKRFGKDRIRVRS